MNLAQALVHAEDGLVWREEVQLARSALVFELERLPEITISADGSRHYSGVRSRTEISRNVRPRELLDELRDRMLEVMRSAAEKTISLQEICRRAGCEYCEGSRHLFQKLIAKGLVMSVGFGRWRKYRLKGRS